MNLATRESPWASFLPAYLLREIKQSSGTPIGMEWRFEAVALFTDVSGFTPMAEVLGQSGKRGTEELTATLNSFFEPMIELIDRYGGTVAKFGGDAMTVLFPCTPDDRDVVARCALQCALEIQEGTRAYNAIDTTAGRFSLTVRQGLGHGAVLSTVVGDPNIQLEHVVAGRLLDLCAEAEHHARPGEVVAHESVLAITGGVRATKVLHGPFSCVSSLDRPPQAASARTGVPTPPAPVAGRFLHPSLAALLEAGQSNLINEHRRVTVLFGRFDDLDYDHDPHAARRLRSYIAEVIRTIERFGGSLRQVDMGDKGSKYIALFGAPIAHEDDEERALHCALELQAIDGFDTAIGVNSGRAFCGLVGSALRREYAVIGDAVNVAARLMQAAEPGRSLVSEGTQGCASTAFTWKALESLPLKGKSEPIQVFEHRPTGDLPVDLHEPEHRLPIVGRAREIDAAQAVQARVLKGRGQILGVTGEAGIGKSRLVAEIVRRAVAEGMVVYAGACQSYGTSSSYLVWRDVWRRFFNVDSALSAEEVADRLGDQLSRVGSDLGARAPLLGAVLNVALPDNALTQSLEPERRTESLKELLVRCLRARASETPILIVLEDCQWIDGLSQELLELVGRSIADLPVLLLVPYRTPDTGQGPLSWGLLRPNCTEIRLDELAPQDVAELIHHKFGQLYTPDTPPAAALVERITARAHGNPFYVEEMVSFFRDCGIDLADDAALAELELPDTLQSLILSRIDMLPDSEKATLKLASVLGRTFKASWLWGSYPEAGTPARVKRSLDVLSRVDLIPLDKPEPELEYIFKHVTTQEVAYESLAFDTRETLHESVGRFIEHSYPDDLDQHLDVLAHHYGRSRNTPKKRVYFRRAGNASARDYANEAAVRYYRLLLPLVPNEEQGDIMLRMGEVLELVGDWTHAEDLFRQALRLGEDAGSELDVARSRAAIGILLSYTHSYDEAVRWLEDAKDRFETIGARREISQLLDRLSFTHYEQSNYSAALAYAQEHLRLAEELDDDAGRSAATSNLGQIYFHQGDHTRAIEYLEEALEISARSGQKRMLIHAGNDLAGVYASQGDYGRAIRYLDEAFAVAAEIGYQQFAGLMLSNAGELCRLQGDIAGAVARCNEALEIAGRLGDRRGILDAISRIGLICAEQGRDTAAERLFDHAIRLSLALNDRWVLCEALFDKARLHADRGQATDAEPMCRDAVELAADVGNREIELPARVLLARLEVEVGSVTPRDGAAVLEGLLTSCLDDVERAAVNYGLWRIDEGRTEASEAAAHLYGNLYEVTPNVEYRDRYERLTGKRLPDPPVLPPVADGVSDGAVPIDAVAARADTIGAQID